MFNLATERRRNKLTQEELAEKVGVSRIMIARYETKLNKPSIDTLKKMAEVLGVTTDYLLEE
jgi:transcriptional regulator with XRE-family HTH domain